MASANGNRVGNWWANVNAWVVSETATTAVVRVECRFQSDPWGYNVWSGNSNSVTCDGQSSGTIGYGTISTSYGQAANILTLSRDFTVTKSTGARNVWCTATFTLGGYQPGTSTAGVNVSIAGITVSAPQAPTGMVAVKSSDWQIRTSWANHPNGVTQPYNAVLLERSVDGGGWSQIASLSATATSHVDSVSPNHRYQYRVRARNSAGYSGYATSGTVATAHTPNAPTSCSASRASDSQAKVTWVNNVSGDRPYDSVLLERQTDTGGWVQIASLGAVVNYTDNGLSANHRYRYRVRARNNGGTSGYSTSGYIYTTPAAPTAVNLSKTGATTVQVSIEGAAPWATAYEVQYRVNQGAWQNASTNVTGWPYAHSPGAGTAQYRVRAKRGSLYSGWRESASITTVVAPSAPTVSMDRAVYPNGTTATVSWVRNHPDGSEQSQAQVEVTGPTGGTYTVQGDASSYALDGLANGSYSVRVRTHGLYDGWGAWSSPQPFRVATSPSVVINYPAVDGDVVDEVPFSVEWEAVDSTGISEQVVRIYYATGGLLYETRVDPGASSFQFGASTYLPQNLKSYAVEVSITGGSSLVTAATRLFAADYAEPARPTAEVTYDEAFAATVAVRHGNPGWVLDGTVLVSPEDSVDEEGIVIAGGITETDEEGVLEIGTVLPTVSVSVVRQMPDGTQWLVADGLGDGQVARDPLPPLNTEFIYLVTSYSEVGTATTREVAAFVDSGGMEAFNFGAGAATCFALGLDASATDSTSYTGETFRFALGEGQDPLPTFYPNGDIDVTGNRSYVVLDRGELIDLRRLLRDPGCALCWFRSWMGDRAKVQANWSFGYDAKRYGTYDVSVQMTEVVMEEAY